MEDNKFTRKVTQDNMVTEKMDIIENRLLGNYDENGSYFIAPQIVNELINLRKYRKSSYGNSMFCVGDLLGYGEIAFEVSFDKSVDENTNAKAKLFVLEDIDKVNGYIQNTIKTLIAEFSSSVSNFIEESYVKFNITNENLDSDEDGKEKKELSDLEVDDSYILAKKAFMLLLEKLENEKLLDAYGKLFTEKLSTLSKMDNEFSKAILEKFNEQYAKIEDLFLKEKNYKDLNELLDSSIEQVSGMNDLFIDQEKEFNDKISQSLETFTDNVNQLNDTSEEKALKMLDKADREKVVEMNESQTENTTISDSDSNGDAQAEIEVNSNTIQPIEENNSYTYILDNPILYETEEEQNESESEGQSEEQTEDVVMTPPMPQITPQQAIEDVQEDIPSSEEDVEEEVKTIEDIIQSVKESSQTDINMVDEKKEEFINEEESSEDVEESKSNYREESTKQIENSLSQIRSSLRQEYQHPDNVEDAQEEIQVMDEDDSANHTVTEDNSSESNVDSQAQTLSNRMSGLDNLRKYLEEKQNRQREEPVAKAEEVVQKIEETIVKTEGAIAEVFARAEEVASVVESEDKFIVNENVNVGEENPGFSFHVTDEELMGEDGVSYNGYEETQLIEVDNNEIVEQKSEDEYKNLDNFVEQTGDLTNTRMDEVISKSL